MKKILIGTVGVVFLGATIYMVTATDATIYEQRPDDSESTTDATESSREATRQDVIDAMRQAGRSEAEINTFIEMQEMPETAPQSEAELMQRNIDMMRNTGASEEQIQDYIDARERAQEQGAAGI